MKKLFSLENGWTHKAIVLIILPIILGSMLLVVQLLTKKTASPIFVTFSFISMCSLFGILESKTLRKNAKQIFKQIRNGKLKEINIEIVEFNGKYYQQKQ